MDDEYETLLVYAVRYALPRRSAGAVGVSHIVVRRAPELTAHTRKQIAREIIDSDLDDQSAPEEWSAALRALEAVKGEG